MIPYKIEKDKDEINVFYIHSYGIAKRWPPDELNFIDEIRPDAFELAKTTSKQKHTLLINIFLNVN